ncbi:hypothetical protein LZ30DRAFT_750723 [Colletotrichum cereale]|nr:hypothetical protein LZ30DRAFT_750723 [Colletotrichum cereale]
MRTEPGFVMGIKISSVEFQEFDSIVVEAAPLEDHKFDFVELSGGTHEQTAWHHRRGSMKAREAFFHECAEKIVPHVSKIIVTDCVRSIGAMLDILQAELDGVGIGRTSALELRRLRHRCNRWAATRSRCFLDTRSRRMAY